jgi:hypothetical protein
MRSLKRPSVPAFVDVGNAPEVLAKGAHEVQIMGSISRIVFYTERRSAQGETFHEPPVSVVVPRDALPGLVLMIVETLDCPAAERLLTQWSKATLN